MTRYASGKFAKGICDRCGFAYKLNSLRELVVNGSRTDFLVCEECWEPDHPQYRVAHLRIDDPQALKNPRPDIPEEEPNG